MSMDTIADIITSIQNADMAKKETVQIPSNKTKTNTKYKKQNESILSKPIKGVTDNDQTNTNPSFFYHPGVPYRQRDLLESKDAASP